MAANADAADGKVDDLADSAPLTDETAQSSPTTGGLADDAVLDDADDGESVDYDAAVDGAEDDTDTAGTDERPVSHVRLAMTVGVVALAALLATAGWLGFRGYQSHQAATQRQMFLQVGRQCALNLTTIDWQHAEADVQRLMDSATGKFFEQFSQREQPFIDVVKKAQSKSVGTITEAGVESESSNKADVLVAVSIKSTNIGGDDEPPREWRMRVSVEKVGKDVKVSNVAFVP